MLCPFFSPVLKNGMTIAATVINKVEMPSPIPAVVKRLLPVAGGPTLALIPAPAVVKRLLPDAGRPTLAWIPAPPLKVKRGDISKDL